MHAWSLAPIPPKTIGAKKRFQGDLDPKLTVLDMPGYGHGSHADWGKDIVKYLTRRRQLRRAFVLVNPVHGLKSSDLQTLELLRNNGISHQLVASKCDEAKASQLPSLLENIGKTVEKHFDKQQGGITLVTLNDVFAVGGVGDGRLNTKVVKGKMTGLDDVRWAIIRATGLEEYAMSLVSGVKPQRQVEVIQPLVQQPSQPMPVISPPSETILVTEELFTPLPIQTEDHPQPQTPMSEAIDATPTHDPNEASPPPTIGIGINEFMAMAGLSQDKKPSKSGSTFRNEPSTRPGSSRREQLRNRRRAPNV